ncbi:hypothetical protein GCM10028857_18920 [Salinarchaeum chitinilyticum]
MSEDPHESDNSSALESGDPDPDYAKHWTNKANQDAVLPEDDIDVKDEWVGVTVYLPQELRDELELVFREHNIACKRADDMELKKLRHFYPLIVAFGLEHLENTDPEDIAPLLSYLSSEYE